MRVVLLGWLKADTAKLLWDPLHVQLFIKTLINETWCTFRKTSTITDNFICSLLIHYVKRNALTNNAFTMCKYQELSSKLFSWQVKYVFYSFELQYIFVGKRCKKMLPSTFLFFSNTIQKTQISAGKTGLDKNVFINRLFQRR